MPAGYWLAPDEPTAEMIRCADTWDDGFGGAWFRARAAALAASPQAPAAPVAVPPGYALVPVEPTPEMLAAAVDATVAAIHRDGEPVEQNELTRIHWLAMLAASPQAAPAAQEASPLSPDPLHDAASLYLRKCNKVEVARCFGGEALAQAIAEKQAAADGLRGLLAASSQAAPAPAAQGEPVAEVGFDQQAWRKLVVALTDLPTGAKLYTHPSPQTQAAEGQWQQIETLPDDTLAILYGAKRSEMVIGMRHSRDGWVIDTPSEWASMYPPKRWMHLPLPPAPEQKGGTE